jgi:hypothetical protein
MLFCEWLSTRKCQMYDLEAWRLLCLWWMDQTIRPHCRSHHSYGLFNLTTTALAAWFYEEPKGLILYRTYEPHYPPCAYRHPIGKDLQITYQEMELCWASCPESLDKMSSKDSSGFSIVYWLLPCGLAIFWNFPRRVARPATWLLYSTNQAAQRIAAIPGFSQIWKEML